MNIEIIYESEDLLVVNKPSGLLVHATPKSGDEKTLADWLLGQNHRIDKDFETPEEVLFAVRDKIKENLRV